MMKQIQQIIITKTKIAHKRNDENFNRNTMRNGTLLNIGRNGEIHAFGLRMEKKIRYGYIVRMLTVFLIEMVQDLRRRSTT